MRGTALKVVPEESRWVERLADALRRAGAPVRSISLCDGLLRVELPLAGGRSFAVTVRPWREGVEGWRRTERLVLGYDGADDPGPEGWRRLELVHALLSRAERELPDGLAGFAAIVEGGGRPEEVLRSVFPFVTVERSAPSARRARRPRAGEEAEVLVRTTSRCNQDCPFCSGPEHGEPTTEVLHALFRAVAELLPGAMLSLTGGEPTLRRGFAEELRAALAMVPRGRIQVQTNAVRFAAAVDPATLPVVPRLRFFVSLHALDQAIYDRCTGTRRQFDKAISGIRRLLATKHRVTLNAVVTQANIEHLEDYVHLLPRMFQDARRPTLHFSVLICPEWNPRTATSLMRYEPVAVLRRAAPRRALGLDLPHASLPACVLPARERVRQRLPDRGARDGLQDPRVRS